MTPADRQPDDLCDHGCGLEATVQHADGRFLCLPCYRTETGGDNEPMPSCPTCGPADRQPVNRQDEPVRDLEAALREKDRVLAYYARTGSARDPRFARAALAAAEEPTRGPMCTCGWPTVDCREGKESVLECEEFIATQLSRKSVEGAGAAVDGARTREATRPDTRLIPFAPDWQCWCSLGDGLPHVRDDATCPEVALSLEAAAEDHRTHAPATAYAEISARYIDALAGRVRDLKAALEQIAVQREQAGIAGSSRDWLIGLTYRMSAIARAALEREPHPLIGTERPPESVFREFRTLHGLPEPPAAPAEEPCHICKQPKDGPGEIFCSYPHPTTLEVRPADPAEER